MTLDDLPGTTITLYCQFFNGEDRGAITTVNTDVRQVPISGLEGFPGRKCPVTEANKSTGDYEVFYKTALNFKMNLGSVKGMASSDTQALPTTLYTSEEYADKPDSK